MTTHSEAVVRMLVCDLDGTLLGNDEALGRFAEWYATHRNRIRLVYASGRCFASVCQVVAATALPAPDAVIADVGTQIRLFDDGQALGEWCDRFRRGWDARRVRAALSAFDALRPQPAEYQSPFKISYYAVNAAADIMRQVRWAGPHIYHSPLSNAAGVLDGLRYWLAEADAP